MKRIAILLLIPFFAGCAYLKAGEIINKSQMSFETFEKDYVELSKASLGREWKHRRLIAEIALSLDTEGKQFSEEEARKLVEKYIDVYREDVQVLDEQRIEHMKGLINSRVGMDLLNAVKNYHKQGLSAEDINTFLIDTVIPSLADLILQKEPDEAESVAREVVVE